MFKILILCLILFFLYVLLLSFVYRDYILTSEYGSSLIFGKRGNGKTTTMQKYNMIYSLRGWRCFSNVDMVNCEKIDFSDLPKYKWPENSLIQIDEASFYALNRNWKDLDFEFIKFLKGARHDKIKTIFYSQSADLDIQIRMACDEMWLLRKFWLFSIARHIIVEPTILNNGSVGNPDLKGKGTGFGDMYSFVPIVVANSFKITFLPRWSAYFDSFENLNDKRPEYVSDFKPDLSLYSKKWYYSYSLNYWKDSFTRFFNGIFNKFNKVHKNKEDVEKYFNLEDIEE